MTFDCAKFGIADGPADHELPSHPNLSYNDNLTTLSLVGNEENFAATTIKT
jgi:hypothetical protein